MQEVAGSIPASSTKILDPGSHRTIPGALTGRDLRVAALSGAKQCFA